MKLVNIIKLLHQNVTLLEKLPFLQWKCGYCDMTKSVLKMAPFTLVFSRINDQIKVENGQNNKSPSSLPPKEKQQQSKCYRT